MGSPADLLDEFARVYARAAVDAFLARAEEGVAGESPEKEAVSDQPAGGQPQKTHSNRRPEYDLIRPWLHFPAIRSKVLPITINGSYAPMVTMKGKRVLTSLYLDPPVHKALRRLSETTRVPAAAYLREAVEDLLKKYGVKAPGGKKP